VPAVNLGDNDFALFGLAPRFALERGALDEHWKRLQREVHPDRHAAAGAAAQRVAMQWSVRVNEAYNRLKDPLRRAAYLCELRGAPIDAERNTAMPGHFLMQQMQWREALDEADTEAALEQLLRETQAARQALLADVQRLLDDENQPQAAAAEVRALMFVERFAEDVHSRLERIAP
jgi:molecular chaperone HscB